MKFRSVSFPRGWESTILVEQSEACTMIHNLPFRKFNRPASSGGGRPFEDKGVGIRLIDDDFFKGMNDRRNKPVTIDDLVRLGERKDIQYENRARSINLQKRPIRNSVQRNNDNVSTVRALEANHTHPADSTKTSHSNHLARTTNGSEFSSEC